MSPEDFMKQVIALYHKARSSKFPAVNIIRGRSSAISSELEDLVAIYLAKNCNPEFTYYLDQCMKFSDGNRYPDIAIQWNNGSIRDLLDVKADIGWKRSTLREFCSEWDVRIEASKNTETAFKLGTTKETKFGIFSNSLKYHVVIVTGKNANKRLDDDVKWVNESLMNVRLYILSKGIHPNEYTNAQGKLLSREKVFHSLDIMSDEFDKLIHAIN